MRAPTIAIAGTGLVTSIGLSAPATCAAIRAKVTNPTETRFFDSTGNWIVAHQVALEKPWRGRVKLARMAALAIDECLGAAAMPEGRALPMLLCVAEKERPGRLAGLDEQLFGEIEHELGIGFGPGSAVIAQGHVGVAVALAQARTLVHEQHAAQVLIAAVDSLLAGQTLAAFDAGDRLLTGQNSNGFIPGEAASAMLVAQPGAATPIELVCAGIGFGLETATIGSGQALRAEGLCTAIRAALAQAGCEMHDLDYRIADVSGEQYQFKEAALALSRILRKRKEEFYMWSPADCIGEVGAAAGPAICALGSMAACKAYAEGPRLLCHFGNDAGQRAALVFYARHGGGV